MDVIWEEPPERSRTGKYDDWLTALAKKPGEWARYPIVFTVAPTASIKKAAEKLDLKVETINRKTEANGKRAIWARVIS